MLINYSDEFSFNDLPWANATLFLVAFKLISVAFNENCKLNLDQCIFVIEQLCCVINNAKARALIDLTGAKRFLKNIHKCLIENSKSFMEN
jgi:hypothetical protein